MGILKLGKGIGVAHGRKIAVIGLGYVGLPVAVSFGRSGVPVVGFDIDQSRIDELRRGYDRTREVEAAELSQPNLVYESDAKALAAGGFLYRYRSDADRRGAAA